MDTKAQNKIKILRIISRLNIGGPAIHTILLTEGFDKGRFETVLVTGTVEKNEGDMFYLAEEKGVRPVFIPELGRALNIRRDFIAFWKLFCLIRKEKPNIIHTHTAKAGALGRLTGLLYKFTYRLSFNKLRNFRGGTPKKTEGPPSTYDLKLIHTFHGHVLHSYFGKIKSTLFTLVEKFLARFTDKIIAVSESVRKELIDLRIVPTEKIVTIPLGLELEKYLKIENNGPKNKNYKSVGIIGRLVPVKNHKIFLEAAKKLKDTSGSKQKIKFFIVGDGHLRPELENYAKRLGIKQNVIFAGWIKDLTQIYSELDIVVLTSLNEGTPVALIEAMAASRPVISTDVGGVKDLFSKLLEVRRNGGKAMIRYYDQGILINSEDAGNMAVAIIELLKNDEVRKKMGNKGRNTVYPKYDISRLLDDMKIFYMHLIGEGT